MTIIHVHFCFFQGGEDAEEEGVGEDEDGNSGEVSLLYKSVQMRGERRTNIELMFNFHSLFLEYIYITVNSQGFDDRKFGRKGGPILGPACRAIIKVNGKDFSRHKRGVNVVSVNPKTGRRSRCFE